jgi:protein phosphatase
VKPAGPVTPPTPPPADVEEPANTGSGFWSSLRDLYRSLTGPGKAPAKPEDDITLELDGPTSTAEANPDPTAPIPTEPPGVCRLDIGSCTSPGLLRPRNEDSLLVVQLTSTNRDQRRDVALIVVADGMGGYEAGDQASALVTQALGQALLGQLAAALNVHGQEAPPAGLAEGLLGAIRTANRTVYEQAQTAPGCKGMGATLAAAIVWEGKALIGHVGDCRVYHCRGSKPEQVTRDQTLVARMVEMGKLTPEEALTHPARNEVTQAVGRSADIHPASHEVELTRGDWLIVACDGLHAHVSSEQLAAVIADAGASASTAATRLVELANVGGGSDNCTVVAVRCH